MTPNSQESSDVAPGADSAADDPVQLPDTAIDLPAVGPAVAAPTPGDEQHPDVGLIDPRRLRPGPEILDPALADKDGLLAVTKLPELSG